MTEIRRPTRRQFIRQSACAAVGMTAAANTLFDLQRIAAAAPLVDSRSLVCVFLQGGNDGNNIIVPTLAADYAQPGRANRGRRPAPPTRGSERRRHREAARP